jgi:xylose isomerase
LWTVGNSGSDPFGKSVSKTLSPVEIVHLLDEVGAWVVNFYKNDLEAIEAMATEW